MCQDRIMLQRYVSQVFQIFPYVLRSLVKGSMLPQQWQKFHHLASYILQISHRLSFTGADGACNCLRNSCCLESSPRAAKWLTRGHWGLDGEVPADSLMWDLAKLEGRPASSRPAGTNLSLATSEGWQSRLLPFVWLCVEPGGAAESIGTCTGDPWTSSIEGHRLNRLRVLGFRLKKNRTFVPVQWLNG